MLKKITNDLEKTSIEKMVQSKNKSEKETEKSKNNLSNNQTLLNKKINSIKEEISSSSGSTSNASSVIDEENYIDMPFLETEGEAAENTVDINERRDVREKDSKARTFAPPDNTEEKADVQI